jgi:Zn-dependent protease with chaperone function
MPDLALIAFWAWSLWATWNVAVFLLAAGLFRPNCPCYTGFRIVLPDWLPTLLTPGEIAAVTAHEMGHKHHGHVWRNLVACCLFLPIDRYGQELQADDFAARAGHAQALATALVKMSMHPVDIARAARLAKL